MKNLKITFILAALATLGPFSIDTYFPSFPAMAEHFQVAEIQVQATLSYYLAALAAMNLFHGAISDAVGRRRVILISLGAYTASSLACLVAPGFGWLLLLRVMQGLAGGAGMIVGRAIIRDLYKGAEAQKLMAHVTMLNGLGPALAPIVGGWLHVGFGWRGAFLFLGLLGFTLLVVSYCGLPETLSPQKRHSLHPVHLSRSYVQTLINPGFLLSCLSLALGGGGFLLYVATAPDVVLNILHLTETQFGWMFLPIVAGLILGSAVSGRLAGRVPEGRLVNQGYGLMAIGAAVNLLINYLQIIKAPWAMFPVTAYTFGFALVAPTVSLQGLDLCPQRKGLAASLQAFIQVIIFALIAGVMAPLVYRSGFKHSIGLASFMGLSWLAHLGYKRCTAANASEAESSCLQTQ